jgi:hypothetical protein
LRRWRCFLFGISDQATRQAEEAAKGEKAHVSRRRISRKKALQVLAEGGRLPEADYLRCKVRYFTDGGAIGDKGFVEGVFQDSRDQFSPKRKQAGHPLRGLVPPEAKEARLHNLRQLQKRVFE